MRVALLRIRLRPREKARLKADADKAGVPVSVYVRRKLFGWKGWEA